MKTQRGHTAREFDAIANALASTPANESLSAPERDLLAKVPQSARTGIDVGCGHGVLTRALAMRGIHMLGIDVSPDMIALATARTGAGVHAEYRVDDVMTTSVPAGTFDVVVSVNVVHHEQLDRIIPRLQSLVAAGGTLLIQDVLHRPGWRNIPVNAMAMLAALTKRMRGDDALGSQVRALYAKHGASESYLAANEVDGAYTRLLPGASITYHLAWRYSIVWRRTVEQ